MENDSLRIENMDKYQSISSDYKEVKEFLKDINSLKDKMKSARSKKDGVCLQTIHASKGPGFPNLFILSMDDEHMPHRFSLKNAKDRDKTVPQNLPIPTSRDSVCFLLLRHMTRIPMYLDAVRGISIPINRDKFPRNSR